MNFSIRAGNEQELRARCGDCRRWKPNQCLLTGNPLFGTVWTGLQSLLTLLVFIKPFYKAYIRLITCSQIPLSSQRENTSSASTSKETPVWSIPPKYSQRCYFHHWSLHFWQYTLAELTSSGAEPTVFFWNLCIFLVSSAHLLLKTIKCYQIQAFLLVLMALKILEENNKATTFREFL